MDFLTAKQNTLDALFATLVWQYAPGTAGWEQGLAQFMTTQGDVTALADMMAGFQDVQAIIMGGGWREPSAYEAAGYTTPEDYLRALFAEAAELAEALGLQDPMIELADSNDALRQAVEDVTAGYKVSDEIQKISTAAQSANTLAQSANTAAQAATTLALYALRSSLSAFTFEGGSYQHGGTVQGYGLPTGAAIPIIAHVGELIVPRGTAAPGAVNITINANGLTLDDPRVLSRVAGTIRKELAYQERAGRN